MTTIQFDHQGLPVVVSGDVLGYEINYPVEYARLSAGNVINIRDWDSEFFIDASGVKHVGQYDGTLQPLNCLWDDDLIQDINGIWIIQSDNNKLTVVKTIQTALLEAAAEDELSNGYISSILGSPHSYDLSSKGLQNITGLAVSARRHEGDGGWNKKIWCVSDGETKPQRIAHSSIQIQDLGDEIIDYIADQQDILETKIDQVEAVEITTILADAIAEIESIVW